MVDLRRLRQGFSRAKRHHQTGLGEGLFCNSGRILLVRLVLIVLQLPVQVTATRELLHLPPPGATVGLQSGEYNLVGFFLFSYK